MVPTSHVSPRRVAAVMLCAGAAVLASTAQAQSSSRAALCDGRVEVVATTRAGSDARGNLVRYSLSFMRADAANTRITVIAQFSPPAQMSSIVVQNPAPFALGPDDRKVIDVAEERLPGNRVTPSLTRALIASHISAECRG